MSGFKNKEVEITLVDGVKVRANHTENYGRSVVHHINAGYLVALAQALEVLGKKQDLTSVAGQEKLMLDALNTLLVAAKLQEAFDYGVNGAFERYAPAPAKASEVLTEAITAQALKHANFDELCAHYGKQKKSGALTPEMCADINAWLFLNHETLVYKTQAKTFF